MTTKFLVPQNTDEGGIGANSFRWAEGNFINLKNNDNDVATTDDINKMSAQSYTTVNKFTVDHTNWKIGDIIKEAENVFLVIDILNLSNELGYIKFN